mmetsp:Transcript_18327/g.42221  ORF Transcript_18327/g.42221 Transcript_18327/m.42221 type:complete len:211 (+) Transcript_18327:1105-1737(+)
MWTNTLSGLSIPIPPKGSLLRTFCFLYPRMMIVHKKTAIPTIRAGQSGFNRSVPLCVNEADAAATFRVLPGFGATTTSPRTGSSSSASSEKYTASSSSLPSSVTSSAPSATTISSPTFSSVGNVSKESMEERSLKVSRLSMVAATSRWLRKDDRSFQAYPAAISSSRSLGTALMFSIRITGGGELSNRKSLSRKVGSRNTDWRFWGPFSV